MSEQKSRTKSVDESSSDIQRAGDKLDNAGSDNPSQPAKEIGGPRGLEPTRYGDWERKGRCIDF